MDRKKLILVVEDDDAVRALVVRALATQYEVREAHRAENALEVLKRIPVPDLIVCDVMMPGIAGTDFIRSLKQQQDYKNVPVIFLTAKSSPLDVIAGINSGARHYVTKPFQMKDLLDKVAKAMK